MKIKENVETITLTTLKISGSAKYYLRARSIKDVLYGVNFAKKHKLPYLILGNGSKVLFRKNYYGLVIQNSIDLIRYKKNILKVASGYKLPLLASFCFKNSITGFEWAINVPGTVGGAIFMNAGAFGTTISDVLIEVTVLETKSGKIKKYLKENLKFDHRYSSFQDKKKNEIILEATFKAQKGDKQEIIHKMEEYKKYRLETQPIGKATLGSIFKKTVWKGKETPAGYLLEKAGCKGLRIGNAQISQKHANFIINKGNATASDILDLISLVKKKVKEKFDIELELEIRII